jgi:hypothetical protein
MSYLVALKQKQLDAHEAWQYERLLVESTKDDAEARILMIKTERRRRGMAYGKS